MSSGRGEGIVITVATQIEEHRLYGHRVFVKRDDLCGRPPAPPLGKMRGLSSVVARLVAEGETTIGCWDTRLSRLGHGLAAVAWGFRGVKTVVCYPHLKGGEVPEPIARAAALGAEIVQMRGNHVSICFSQATRIVARKGGVMIPFGMECPESVEAIAEEAREVPPSLLRGGTVVVCCGSGVTLAGLLRGLVPMPRQVIGVSSGRSLDKIRQCVRRHLDHLPANLTLIPARMPYDSRPSIDSPFPTHPNYDLKAWEYLAENVHRLHPPLLFWNIGA
jgi:1-aminocyclopropane-1-carboxylate deaminase/D-cysteine desulfhydrase-like pyridoxal-dependent ACC family enzyme